MMLFLQRYNFTVVYRKGSSLHLADTLSRAPCQDNPTTPSIPETFQVFQVHLSHLDPSSRHTSALSHRQWPSVHLKRIQEICPDVWVRTRRLVTLLVSQQRQS